MDPPSSPSLIQQYAHRHTIAQKPWPVSSSFADARPTMSRPANPSRKHFHPPRQLQHSLHPSLAPASAHASSASQPPLLLPSLSHAHICNPATFQVSCNIRKWIPLIMYALTSAAFVLAIAAYRDQLFSRLDQLAQWLRADKTYGYAVLFALIFITTIPPIPLYSTFIVLSGYTFGAWTGAIISYMAALSGALAVFMVSRALLRDTIGRWLAACQTLQRAVRAIEKRPRLLFLVRLAPYPYNVMNCLLAASPTLKLRTYTLCTAASLVKVLIHTSMGASIHSFKDVNEDQEVDDVAWGRAWTVLGTGLCVAVLVYLSVVARRAVDEELDDGGVVVCDSEETRGFLEPDAASPRAQEMLEVPFRASRFGVLLDDVRGRLEEEEFGEMETVRWV